MIQHEERGQEYVLRSEEKFSVDQSREIGRKVGSCGSGMCSVCLEEIGEYSFCEKNICSSCLDEVKGVMGNIRV